MKVILPYLIILIVLLVSCSIKKQESKWFLLIMTEFGKFIFNEVRTEVLEKNLQIDVGKEEHDREE
jgi:hypothetical protein